MSNAAKAAAKIGEDYVTTSDVATHHNVPIRDVQYYIKKGTIPAEKVGYFYLIHKRDIPKTWPPQ